MQFWQSIAFVEAEQIVPVVRLCEELGFDGVAISDHLLHFHELRSPYPYSPDGRPPSFSPETVWPESWSLIAALAAVTERIRFATNVYILPLRHPVEVAKATASVASFAEGRVVLGAGAGWMKEEFDALGIDFASRGRRFDECIEVIRKLWTGDAVEHSGEFFAFPKVQMCPVPSRPIPILIGGLSQAALRRAANLGDGWIGPGQTLDDALATLRRLAELRERAGRSHLAFETIVPLAGPPDVDAIRRLEEAGADGTTSFPFTFTIGPRSSFEAKREYLQRYAEEVIARVRR